MATILTFQRSDAKRCAASEPGVEIGSVGQLILFTGIRYERSEFDHPVTPDCGRAVRQRDRIALLD